MSEPGALIVFAREPRVGEVKTRLALDLGAARAAEIYSGLLTRTLRLAEASRFGVCYLFAASSGETAYFKRRLDRERWRVRTQCRGDIGQRMYAAIEVVLEEHDFAVLIGSDVADSEVADLDLAWDTLAQPRSGVVMGPSADGGYWLIGLREAHAVIFEDIAWSTPAVLAATLARLAALGIDAISLTPRNDVDDVDDLRFLLAAE